MLRSGMILMIREKAQSGKSAYAIGKELNISKNTARKYIEWQGVPPPKIDRPSKLDSFKPLLHDLMSEGIFNCVVLLERLKDAGYEGGITILKNTFIPSVRPKRCQRPDVLKRQAVSRRRWTGASVTIPIVAVLFIRSLFL